MAEAARPAPSDVVAQEPAYILEDSAFVRLWQGLMTARAMIALALVILITSVSQFTRVSQPLLLAVCAAYLVQALGLRLLARPRAPGRAFDRRWVWTIGVDLAVFSVLEFGQGSGINYTPLFAIPVLVAAVMGSGLLALGTASCVTLALLVNAYLISLRLPAEAASSFVQAGLTGTGYLFLAFLINQLASRLSGEEQRARRSQRAARIQTQVNQLVIEFLDEGVLVVDRGGVLRAVNPASRRLLAWPDGGSTDARLADQEGGAAIWQVADQAFGSGLAQSADLTILHGAQGHRPIHVRTRLTTSIELQAERLCVVFLQDLREMEAKIRTEKLAAMGRMSTAVAHEIRNPLAAISQANALLEEDLVSPAHRRLTTMVGQNARRLSQIVEEVLDISRVEHRLGAEGEVLPSLNASVATACEEWGRQTSNLHRLSQSLAPEVTSVRFEAAHLQRLLVNLLDNAARYAGERPDSIQVSTTLGHEQVTGLHVWSDGLPLEAGVLGHLFEPFFSSESRSTGLGLYICRELCERHGARIAYRRSVRLSGEAPVEGNEFHVDFWPRFQPSVPPSSQPMISV